MTGIEPGAAFWAAAAQLRCGDAANRDPHPVSCRVARPIFGTVREPLLPDDLLRHDCIQFLDAAAEPALLLGIPARCPRCCRLRLRGGSPWTDVDTMLAACLAGGGTAQVMAFGVEDLLSSGQLVNLFPDWSDQMFPLYAVHPSRRHVPAEVRAFIGFSAGRS